MPTHDPSPHKKKTPAPHPTPPTHQHHPPTNTYVPVVEKPNAQDLLHLQPVAHVQIPQRIAHQQHVAALLVVRLVEIRGGVQHTGGLFVEDMEDGLGEAREHTVLFLEQHAVRHNVHRVWQGTCQLLPADLLNHVCNARAEEKQGDGSLRTQVHQLCQPFPDRQVRVLDRRGQQLPTKAVLNQEVVCLDHPLLHKLDLLGQRNAWVHLLGVVMGLKGLRLASSKANR